jgi:hypothetical protein
MNDTVNDVDPTSAYYMRVAATALRDACHAAYDAPRTTDSVYDRAGTLHDLLCKVEQLAQHLARDIKQVADDPRLRSSDGDARTEAQRAQSRLGDAAKIVRCATTEVNAAWAHLSEIYLAEET